MSDNIVISDYSLNNGIFMGTIKCDMISSVDRVYLKNIKRGETTNNVNFERDEKAGVINFSFDMDTDKISDGTWYPIVVTTEGNEFFCEFNNRKNNRPSAILIELSKKALFFDAKNKRHYMGAIDKLSRFAVRKWRNKNAFIKKRPIYVKDFSANNLNVDFQLKNIPPRKTTQAELWLWSRGLKIVHRIPVSADAVNKGHFTIDLSEFKNKHNDKFGRLWEMYLVRNVEGTYVQSRINYRNALKGSGKVQKTDTDDSDRYVISQPASENADFEWAFQVYFDQLSQLCCKLVERKMMYRGMFRGLINDYSLKQSILTMHIFCKRDEFSDRRLILRYKSTDGSERIDEYEFTKTDERPLDDGMLYTFTIDYKNVNWIPLRYELIMLGESEGYWYEFRLVGGTAIYKTLMTSVYKNSYLTNDGVLVYITDSIGQKIVIECRQKTKYDNKKYRINESIALVMYKLFGKILRRKNNLLFYEKFCTAAQDNSYYMFDYFIGKKDRNIRPLYVIEGNSLEYRELKSKYGRNILKFMSIRHLVYLQAARLFVSTDSKRHCYRWRSGNTRMTQILNKKKFVFLQHGVIGFKRVDNIYGKQFENKADLFIASSDGEKEIIKKWFGYSDKEIVVTGLARWDKMHSNPQTPPMIFYMPTWRNWVYEVSEEEFVKTDYYQAYSEIINSPQLDRVLNEYNTDLIFCLHPKFKDYLHRLKSGSNRIKVFDFNDCKVNEMLMKCSAFITDYSSASWDVYYMQKPVIFYQYDYEKYLEKQGSYLNLEKGVFGTRVTEFNEFLEALKNCIADGFKDSPQSEVNIDKYLPLRDGKHRKRIYSAIMKILK